MIALAVVLLALLALALLPVGARLRYDDGDFCLQLAAGPLRVRILPRPSMSPEKAEKRQKKRDKRTKERQKKKEKTFPAPKEKTGLTFRDIKPLIRPALELAASLPRKLLVRELTLHVTYGAENAAAAAIGYGRAWAVIGAITPVLENTFRIRKRDVGAYLDYGRTELGVFAELDIRMRVGTAVLLGLKAGWMALKVLMQNRNKGGADK